MFTNKTIIITGASSGLGRALAIELSKKGANLLLIARNQVGLQETYHLCAKTARSPLIFDGDITIKTDCQAAVMKALAHFGKIDYLLLNAGISMWAKFQEVTDLAMMSKIMDINYFGNVALTHYALPALIKSKGTVVVISSIQGKIGAPFHSGYAASKHALEGFFNSLRLELQKRIHILMVYPGWIKETQLKAHALGHSQAIDEKRKLKHHKKGLSLEVCTKRIMHAMLNKRKNLIMPRHYYALPFLQLLCPPLLDYLVNKNV